MNQKPCDFERYITSEFQILLWTPVYLKYFDNVYIEDDAETN